MRILGRIFKMNYGQTKIRPENTHKILLRKRPLVPKSMGCTSMYCVRTTEIGEPSVFEVLKEYIIKTELMFQKRFITLMELATSSTHVAGIKF